MTRLVSLALIAALVVSVPALTADPPTAPPPRRVVIETSDPSLADWTPRPATGKAEPWEKAVEKDWLDPRFKRTDTGPFFACTAEYPMPGGKPRIPKAVGVKLGANGDAGLLYDRATMRLVAGWSGGFLTQSDKRFGLLNTPTPKGEVVFASSPGPGWAGPGLSWDLPNRITYPLPKNWLKYRGLHLHGDRVALRYTVGDTEVIETATVRREVSAGTTEFRVSLRLAANAVPLRRHLLTLPAKADLIRLDPRNVRLSELGGKRYLGITPDGQADGVEMRVAAGSVYALIPASRTARVVEFVYRQSAGEDALAGRNGHDIDDPLALTRPGPRRWGEPLVTRLECGSESGAFVIDTLTLPQKNPFEALFFCTGLDFLPDGRVAVCTCHGDVWLATVDERAGTVAWQRFATGMYQPLGLKVVDGQVVVLERGQLTRLHDTNGDGEADYYECLSNEWHTGPGEHSYDTCLETDPRGNFYFFKTGDPHAVPHGGCLLRVGKDGGPAEVFATGFRHPIGLGMSPGGVLTGADQEGNWMPATRIDQYKKGGFYGDLRALHRYPPLAIFDPPICWVPREADNSAGGQVWVPDGAWGPLGGKPLHLSYGRCKAFVLLRQETPSGVVQGGVADLGLSFLSGVCRGRFSPADGHLYVCGLNGWQTAAKADGCVQRVRYTGKSYDLPVGLAVEGNAVNLTFSRPLPAENAAADLFRVAQWNYRWTADYGSRRWKVSDPTREGQDEVPVRKGELSGDRRTLTLRFDEVKRVMQMQIGYNLTAADGRRVAGSVYLTVNSSEK